MRICVFTYDHPHRKTSEGLAQMWLHNFMPDLIWAAPWKDMGKRFNFYEHPRLYAGRMGCLYEVASHRKPIMHRCDLGVILGAKILPAAVIDSFSCGIINIHPGRIQDHGGLKSLEWEWLQPAEITAHYIDERVDMGWPICTEPVERYDGDTYEAFVERIMRLQAKLLPRAIWEAVQIGPTYKERLALA